MQFQGPVEPFMLTVKQLEIVRVCWNDVQGFLSVKAGTSHSSQGQQEPVDKAARAPRTREIRGWTAERAAALGVSPIPNPNAPQNGGREVVSNSSETDDDEETGPGLESPMFEDQEINGEDLPVRERPNYGISRIDQPEKVNHGWYVRIAKSDSP
jgi:hypothetical protein